MIKLVQKEVEAKPWTVVISGETWQDDVTTVDKVTEDELQLGNEYFDALLVLKAFYDKGFMNNGNMDDNEWKLQDNLIDTYDVEIDADDEYDFLEAIDELLYATLPKYFNGDGSDYPYRKLNVDIYDGEGQKYGLEYDDEDVVTALKNLELVK